ncbi:MAG: DUF4136 domain-containing protein [Reichenbachiella sp.]
MIIESDYSYSGRFNKYKTYDFLIMQDNDNEAHKAIIEKNVISKMESQGYRLSKEKPDLLISYKVFNDDFDIKGYNQPHFESWVSNNWSDIWLAQDANMDGGNHEVNAEYNDTKYFMTGGTLHISFFDRKRRQTVWQGYASGVFSAHDESSERSVKVATNKIFRQFRIISDGYVSRRKSS